MHVTVGTTRCLISVNEADQILHNFSGLFSFHVVTTTDKSTDNCFTNNSKSVGI